MIVVPCPSVALHIHAIRFTLVRGYVSFKMWPPDRFRTEFSPSAMVMGRMSRQSFSMKYSFYPYPGSEQGLQGHTRIDKMQGLAGVVIGSPIFNAGG